MLCVPRSCNSWKVATILVTTCHCFVLWVFTEDASTPTVIVCLTTDGESALMATDDVDDFDFAYLDEVEQQHAARTQQAGAATFQPGITGTSWGPNQEQKAWMPHLHNQQAQPMQQQPMQYQQQNQPWQQPNQQSSAGASNMQQATAAPSGRPFGQHNPAAMPHMQQHNSAPVGPSMHHTHQLAWQQKQQPLPMPVQQTAQPASLQQHQNQQSQQQPWVQQAQNQQTRQTQQQIQQCSNMTHAEQQPPAQQQQQQAPAQHLMQAPHLQGMHSTAAGLSSLGNPRPATLSAQHHNAAARNSAGSSAAAAQQLQRQPQQHRQQGTSSGDNAANGRARVRPLNDDTMQPYQQQPAVQQRNQAKQHQKRQQQQKQQSGQTDMRSFFAVGAQKHTGRESLQPQCQQHQRGAQFPNQRSTGATAAAAAARNTLQDDDEIIELVSDDDEGNCNAQNDKQQQQQAQPQQQQQPPVQQQQPVPQQVQHKMQQTLQRAAPQPKPQPKTKQLHDAQDVAQLLQLAYPGRDFTTRTHSQLPDMVPCPATDSEGIGNGCMLNAKAAETWIYPAKPEPRSYQFDIAWQTIRHNTLACLPTGLGKTLIAAVVMYNFYRWFPTGKVVFITPTRALVEQQFEACKHTMGIHQDDVAMLTGSHAAKRGAQWEKHRVFVTTPQCLHNDLKHGRVFPRHIVCLVIDECHRATGDADMAMAVKLMREYKARFRVLGLSATPGNSYRAIQEVVTNLMIRRIEYRDELDSTVAQYCFAKQKEERVVPVCQEGRHIKGQLQQLMVHVVAQLNSEAGAGLAIPSETYSLSRYAVEEARRRCNAASAAAGRGRGRFGSSSSFGSIKPAWGRGSGGRAPGSSANVHTLWETLLVLVDVQDKFETLGSQAALEKLMEVFMGTGAVTMFLRSQPRCEDLIARLKATAAVPHPKLPILAELLQQHFEQQQATDNEVSRAIVFCSYRDQVKMVKQYLQQFEPLIVCSPFIGQGNGSKKAKGGAAAAAAGSGGGVAACGGDVDVLNGGMKQWEQQAVLKDYREGKFNVLLATCIGEEGLDIPQVDLIICWDNSSPSRTRQREGRTGRHREGRVVYLLHEGREYEQYLDNQRKEEQVKANLRKPDSFDLCPVDVPMLPVEANPVPTLVTLPEPALQQVKPGRGKRAAAAAAAGEAAPAAKRPRPKKQPQQAGISFAAVEPPAGMGYAALKHLKSANRAQQQQQQQVRRFLEDTEEQSCGSPGRSPAAAAASDDDGDSWQTPPAAADDGLEDWAIDTAAVAAGAPKEAAAAATGLQQEQQQLTSTKRSNDDPQEELGLGFDTLPAADVDVPCRQQQRRRRKEFVPVMQAGLHESQEDTDADIDLSEDIMGVAAAGPAAVAMRESTAAAAAAASDGTVGDHNMHGGVQVVCKSLRQQQQQQQAKQGVKKMLRGKQPASMAAAVADGGAAAASSSARQQQRMEVPALQQQQQQQRIDDDSTAATAQEAPIVIDDTEAVLADDDFALLDQLDTWEAIPEQQQQRLQQQQRKHEDAGATEVLRHRSGRLALETLLPPGCWLAQHLLHKYDLQQQQQQQQQRDAKQALGKAEDNGDGAGSSQPAAAAAGASTDAERLSAVLEQLMQPMTAVEVEAAAMQYGDHPLVQLAMLGHCTTAAVVDHHANVAAAAGSADQCVELVSAVAAAAAAAAGQAMPPATGAATAAAAAADLMIDSDSDDADFAEQLQNAVPWKPRSRPPSAAAAAAAEAAAEAAATEPCMDMGAMGAAAATPAVTTVVVREPAAEAAAGADRHSIGIPAAAATAAAVAAAAAASNMDLLGDSDAEDDPAIQKPNAVPWKVRSKAPAAAPTAKPAVEAAAAAVTLSNADRDLQQDLQAEHSVSQDDVPLLARIPAAAAAAAVKPKPASRKTAVTNSLPKQQLQPQQQANEDLSQDDVPLLARIPAAAAAAVRPKSATRNPAAGTNADPAPLPKGQQDMHEELSQDDVPLLARMPSSVVAVRNTATSGIDTAANACQQQQQSDNEDDVPLKARIPSARAKPPCTADIQTRPAAATVTGQAGSVDTAALIKQARLLLSKSFEEVTTVARAAVRPAAAAAAAADAACAGSSQQQQTQADVPLAQRRQQLSLAAAATAQGATQADVPLAQRCQQLAIAAAAAAATDMEAEANTSQQRTTQADVTLRHRMHSLHAAAINAAATAAYSAAAEDSELAPQIFTQADMLLCERQQQLTVKAAGCVAAAVADQGRLYTQADMLLSESKQQLASDTYDKSELVAVDMDDVCHKQVYSQAHMLLSERRDCPAVMQSEVTAVAAAGTNEQVKNDGSFQNAVGAQSELLLDGRRQLLTKQNESSQQQQQPKDDVHTQQPAQQQLKSALVANHHVQQKVQQDHIQPEKQQQQYVSHEKVAASNEQQQQRGSSQSSLQDAGSQPDASDVSAPALDPFGFPLIPGVDVPGPLPEKRQQQQQRHSSSGHDSSKSADVHAVLKQPDPAVDPFGFPVIPGVDVPAPEQQQQQQQESLPSGPQAAAFAVHDPFAHDPYADEHTDPWGAINYAEPDPQPRQQQQQRQQQQRRHSGLGKNRSRAEATRRTVVSSWDEVCTQKDTKPAAAAAAAAAAVVVGGASAAVKQSAVLQTHATAAQQLSAVPCRDEACAQKPEGHAAKAAAHNPAAAAAAANQPKLQQPVAAAAAAPQAGATAGQVEEPMPCQHGLLLQSAAAVQRQQAAAGKQLSTQQMHDAADMHTPAGGSLQPGRQAGLQEHVLQQQQQQSFQQQQQQDCHEGAEVNPPSAGVCRSPTEHAECLQDQQQQQGSSQGHLGSIIVPDSCNELDLADDMQQQLYVTQQPGGVSQHHQSTQQQDAFAGCAPVECTTARSADAAGSEQPEQQLVHQQQQCVSVSHAGPESVVIVPDSMDEYAEMHELLQEVEQQHACGQQQQQDGACDTVNAVPDSLLKRSHSKATQQQHCLKQQQQQDIPSTDSKLNRQLRFEQGCMSPPPARPPSARKPHSFNSALGASGASGCNRPGGLGHSKSQHTTPGASKATGARQPCTWEADLLKGNAAEWHIAGSSSKPAKRDQASAAARADAAFSSSFAAAAAELGIAVTPARAKGSTAAAAASGGLSSEDVICRKRKRRGRGAVLLTQHMPSQTHSPAVAAAAQEECLQDSDDEQQQQQQQQQQVGSQLQRQQQQGRAAAEAAVAASSDEEDDGLVWQGRRKKVCVAATPSTAAAAKAAGRGKHKAAAAASAKHRKPKRCAFIDELAELSGSGESGDESNSCDEDDNDDLSGFITNGTTPATTERSTPGMALYHRSMMQTQTPGVDNIWALVNGRNRAPPPRYNRSNNTSKEQHADGGWHVSKGGSKKQRAEAGAVEAETLDDSPPDRDLAVGLFGDEPAGIALTDTPSWYKNAGVEDEYETDSEISSEIESEEDSEVHSQGEQADRQHWQKQQHRRQKQHRRDHCKARNRHSLTTDEIQEPSELVDSVAKPQPPRRAVGGTSAAGAAAGGQINRNQQQRRRRQLVDDSGDDQEQQPLHVVAPAIRRKALGNKDSSARLDAAVGKQQQQQRANTGQARQQDSDIVVIDSDSLSTGDSSEQRDASDSDAVSANSGSEASDCHDDECDICGLGGELLLCDGKGCKTACHLQCVGLKRVPSGEWYCVYCQSKL